MAKNVAFVLVRAMEAGEHCLPGTAHILDGHHSGTLFTWVGDEWHVTDIENRKYVCHCERLAVVTLKSDADADNGLNQAALGCDLDCGEWVVDADDLPDLRESYGDDLEVIWEQ